MRALTIWQPWASLIMAGAKPYEFRRWPAPAALVGKRIVIHAGARKVQRDEIAELIGRCRFEKGFGTGLKDEIALPLLERWHVSPGMLPLASCLGAAALGQPRRASDLFRGTVADSRRIDQHIWAWPLTEIQPFEPPIPAKGAQGFWDWREAE